MLKELRVKKGFSQEDLAELTGVSRSEIQAIERGRRQEVSVEIARKLAVHLGVHWTIFFEESA